MWYLNSEMDLKRAFYAINRMNKKGGFDCPGCAWPDPDDRRSVLGEYCENGAKALAEEATLKKVGEKFFSHYSIDELRSWSDFQLGKSGRITQPMLITSGDTHYRPISWEEAYRLIGNQLRQLDDPNQAVFYTSGRSSNEAAYLYGLLARRLGTNNLPDCSNMCHESSGVGLSETLGIGKGSVLQSDFKEAEVIVIIGQNPGTNHPRMLTTLQEAKDNGAKIITINPLEEAGLRRFKNPQRPQDIFGSGTAITDVYLRVRINQDIPLLKAIMKGLLSAHLQNENVLDTVFIEKYTTGFDQLKTDLDGYDVNTLLRQAGISRNVLDEALKLLIPAKKIIICWAMGLTQHKNGVDNIKECVNILLMKGALGKRGAGTCPVRGHSNVQGDRTVGINHRLSPDMASRIRSKYGFEPPLEEGYDVVRAFMAMQAGKVKVFTSLGGNIIGAMSDTEICAGAMQQCDMTIHISTKLCRTHLYPGHVGLILPTLGRSEKDISRQGPQRVTVENSMGKVHASQGVLNPVSSDLMSEPAIVCGIAKSVFPTDSCVDWDAYAHDYEIIRKDISAVISGFEQYNKRVAGGKEFYLPNNSRKLDFSKLPKGKAQFSVCPLPDHALEKDEFLMMTIRSHDQFNTTIYGLDDRYRGIFNERRIVLMNEKDLERLNLKNLDIVSITSSYDDVDRSVHNFHVVSYDIPIGNLAAYFPETNPLIPLNQFAKGSGTPISKSIRVKILKS